MAAATEVPITGSVLGWAIDEAGFSEAEVARRVKVDVTTLQAFITGTQRPNKTQFSKLVDAVRRPSAIFFMPEPPARAALPTRFRSSPEGHDLGPAAIREVRKARRLQEVMSWLLRQDDGSPDTADVGAVDWKSTNPTESGESYRSALGLTLADQVGWRDQADALRQWRSIYDEMGILVFSLQLGKSEIRGFSAWDDRAPVIAANTAYVESARIFTMAHEYAHLVSRTDAACQTWLNPNDSEEPGIERWCERFAAAFLLPPTTLKPYLAYQFSISESRPVEDFDTVWRVSRRLKVSARALAIALQELRLAPTHLYDLVEQEADKVDRRPHRQDEGGGGGFKAFEARVMQYGVRTTSRVLEAGASGELGERDVADYLALDIGGIDDLERYLRRFPAVRR